MNKEQCAALLEIFERFVDSHKNNEDPWDVLEELMALRADFSFKRALKGFQLDYDEAIKLLNNDKDLPDEDKEKRKIVMAAFQNLVEFAIAAEYTMANKMPVDFDDFIEGEVGIDEIDQEEAEDNFELYNLIYAAVENEDIEYSMAMALALLKHSDGTTLTYMTQGDERVRPWHMQYEGYTAPKEIFPSWLIPPIEHMCRCFLVEDTLGNGVDSLANTVIAQAEPKIPEWFNPTFKESVAKGGRIFSDEHPYFKVKKGHFKKLTEISERIKSKYINATRRKDNNA